MNYSHSVSTIEGTSFRLPLVNGSTGIEPTSSQAPGLLQLPMPFHVKIMQFSIQQATFIH